MNSMGGRLSVGTIPATCRRAVLGVSGESPAAPRPFGERPPTPRQLELMAAYVQEGSEKAAAHVCRITLGRFKNQMTELYRRLGAESNIDALRLLGWLKP